MSNLGGLQLEADYERHCYPKGLFGHKIDNKKRPQQSVVGRGIPFPDERRTLVREGYGSFRGRRSAGGEAPSCEAVFAKVPFDGCWFERAVRAKTEV